MYHCNNEYWVNTMEHLTFGKILNDHGYNTFYGGKYLNVYPGKHRPTNDKNKPPPGCDDFYG